jgi:hypothetical protein
MEDGQDPTFLCGGGIVITMEVCYYVYVNSSGHASSPLPDLHCLALSKNGVKMTPPEMVWSGSHPEFR